MENIKNLNWNGEVNDSPCSVTQMTMIEQYLVFANIDQREKDLISASIEKFSEQEAYETITYLKENQVEQRPRKQFEQWIKRSNNQNK